MSLATKFICSASVVALTRQDEDRQANDRALAEGERILSVYRSVLDIKFWIVTEADRSVTTILLPEDY
jgi:hypothetical protein